MYLVCVIYLVSLLAVKLINSVDSANNGQAILYALAILSFVYIMNYYFGG